MSEFAKDVSAPVVVFDSADVTRLKDLATHSAKNRFRYCAHGSTNNPVQEMLICARQHTYLPPHRHPSGKCESYHVVEGQAEVFLMSEDGHVLQQHLLGDGRHPGAFFFRISEPIYHFVFPRSEWFIYHEVYSGPWSREMSVIPAPFAPHENDKDAVAAFIKVVTGVDTAT